MILHWELGSGLAGAAEEADKQTADLIRAGFPLLVDYEFERIVDELCLSAPSGGTVFASVSPETVKTFATAAGRVDLPDLACKVEPENPAAAQEYLRQWVEVFEEAARRGMGLVGQMG
jgi:hypothetical protein